MAGTARAPLAGGRGAGGRRSRHPGPALPPVGGLACASVEGGAMLARELTAGATTPVGSLLLSLYEGQPERFAAALRSTRRLTGGAMLFDLVFLERYGWWNLLRP